MTATVSGSPASIHASHRDCRENGELTLVNDEEIMSPGSKPDADGSFVPEWKDGMKFNYTIKPQVSEFLMARALC